MENTQIPTDGSNQQGLAHNLGGTKLYDTEYHKAKTDGKQEVYTTRKPMPSGTRSIIHNGKRAARMFDVSSIDADEVKHLLSVVVANGDCACFSLTSDGGALAITILSGGTRHKAYAATADGFLERASELLETLY